MSIRHIQSVPAPARGSSTQFALLGLLSLCPGSGYDLKKLAASSVGHFWSESYGQIYPTLKQLDAAGLITATVAETPGKPDRIVYQITDAGLAALQAWLLETPRTEPARLELLLKLFFGEHAGRETNIAHVERARERELARLREYDEIERRIKRSRAPERKYWLYTLRYGRARSRAVVEWADETLRSLRASPSQPMSRADTTRARKSGRTPTRQSPR